MQGSSRQASLRAETRAEAIARRGRGLGRRATGTPTAWIEGTLHGLRAPSGQGPQGMSSSCPRGPGGMRSYRPSASGEPSTAIRVGVVRPTVDEVDRHRGPVFVGRRDRDRRRLTCASVPCHKRLPACLSHGAPLSERPARHVRHRPWALGPGLGGVRGRVPHSVCHLRSCRISVGASKSLLGPPCDLDGGQTACPALTTKACCMPSTTSLRDATARRDP
jgi:hypothetical protein